MSYYSKTRFTRDKPTNEFLNHLSFYHDFTIYSTVIKMAAIKKKVTCLFDFKTVLIEKNFSNFIILPV